MTIKTCCFCFSIRGGVVFIAILSILLSLSNVSGMLRSWKSRDEQIEYNKSIIAIPCPKSETIKFQIFIPAVFTDNVRKMFIFFYFISSGLLLTSTLQNGKSGFIPWICLSTIGMIFHIESIISGFLKMLAYCDTSYGSRILIQLIMIYGLEIYAIMIVYHYYKQLGEETVDQTNERVFSCEDNAQSYVNNIPDVVTCPIPNDLPPSYEQVVGNAPRYPVY